MTDPALIGAFAAVFTALAGVITAVTILISKLKENTLATKETRAMVNSINDTHVVRLAQLTNALTSSGVKVPVDPAIAAASQRLEQHNID